MDFLNETDRMNLSCALYALENYGAEITKLEGQKYKVNNNGIWGLHESGGVMVLDADDIIELAEQYTDFMAE
jgi:hypothetical protein